MDSPTPKRARGRPRSIPSQHVMVRMSPDLITRIDTYTETLQTNNPGLNVSRADTIRTICERFLTTIQHDLVREERRVYQTSRRVQQPIKMPASGMRKSIIKLLRQYPHGLSPAEIRRHLNVDKDLGSTLKAMVRDRLLTRIETGRYISNEDTSNG